MSALEMDTYTVFDSYVARHGPRGHTALDILYGKSR